MIYARGGDRDRKVPRGGRVARAGRRRPSARGVTLIELLGVIVIVSLAAGGATAGLAAASESARLGAAAAQWRDLDARARLSGRCLGPVVMGFDGRGREVVLRPAASGERLAQVTLPRSVSARIVAGTPTDSIAFDALGRSADYEVELKTAARVARWRVGGLTGTMKEMAR